MKKKVIAVLIQANQGDKTGLYKYYDDYYYNKKGDLTNDYNPHAFLESQHLYFTSDEKPKKGEWGYYAELNTFYQPDREYEPEDVYKKIVASTDPSLGLPDMSEQFLKEYIAVNGECEVEIEIELHKDCWDAHNFGDPWGPEHYIPKIDSEGNLILSIAKKKAEIYTSPLLEKFIALGSTEDGWDIANRVQEEAIQQQINEAANKYPYGGREGSKRQAFLNGVEWARKNLL